MSAHTCRLPIQPPVTCPSFKPPPLPLLRHTICFSPRRSKAVSQRNLMDRKKKGDGESSKPPLMALNHVSRLCKDVKKSLEFYKTVLGFVEIERPASFDFDGAWLFNYGVGIHLVQAKDEDKLPSDTDHLDPMDNHISFQCEDMEALEKRLKEVEVKYIKRTVGDQKDAAIDQLFFNDPDGFMVEICNCENLELVPRNSADAIRLPEDRHAPPVSLPGSSDHREPQPNS